MTVGGLNDMTRPVSDSPSQRFAQSGVICCHRSGDEIQPDKGYGAPWVLHRDNVGML